MSSPADRRTIGQLRPTIVFAWISSNTMWHTTDTSTPWYSPTNTQASYTLPPLPENLWPEYWSAASFLHNRSPRQQNSWKSPSEILAEWFKAKRVPGFNTSENDFRPDWNVTFAYGCRAYPLITAYKAGKQKIHF